MISLGYNKAITSLGIKIAPEGNMSKQQETLHQKACK